MSLIHGGARIFVTMGKDMTSEWKKYLARGFIICAFFLVHCH